MDFHAERDTRSKTLTTVPFSPTADEDNVGGCLSSLSLLQEIWYAALKHYEQNKNILKCLRKGYYSLGFKYIVWANRETGHKSEIFTFHTT